jgi:hypothetical protein
MDSHVLYISRRDRQLSSGCLLTAGVGRREGTIERETLKWRHVGELVVGRREGKGDHLIGQPHLEGLAKLRRKPQFFDYNIRFSSHQSFSLSLSFSSS